MSIDNLMPKSIKYNGPEQSPTTNNPVIGQRRPAHGFNKSH